MPNVAVDQQTWVETKTSDNKVYYYNSVTKVTTWKRPENVKIVKYEQLAKQAAAAAAASDTNNKTDNSSNLASSQSVNDKNHSQEYIKSSASETTTSSTLASSKKPTVSNGLDRNQSNNVSSELLNRTSSNSNNGNSSGKANPKPVSTTPIPGTPWCIVWTDQNTMFYFNPSTKTSTWQRPPELKDRKDVDELTDANARADKTDDNRDMYEHKNSQPEKRPKLDLDSDGSLLKDSDLTRSLVAKPGPTKKNQGPTAEEIEALRSRDKIPFDERVKTFKDMLEEKQVNLSSTFQRELSKIVFDPRYLLLNSNERRDVFDTYCMEKIEEERRKKKEKTKKAIDDFKALLERARLTPRSSFIEFHKMFCEDPNFKNLDKEKDRELLFEDHLALLRRKEREERAQRAHTSADSRGMKRDSERHRDRHHHMPQLTREEAEDVFSAMLIELITDHELDWHEAKRILRKSSQFHLLDDLPREWKQATFEKHCRRLHKRRKDKFIQLLNETKEITIETDWRSLRRLIREDPRYIKFSRNDRRCEREFEEFRCAKLAALKTNFRELLKETTLIDSNTRKTIQDSQNQHLIDIIGSLQNDKRYKDLDAFSEERRKILLSYIEELAAKANSSQDEIQVEAQVKDNDEVDDDDQVGDNDQVDEHTGEAKGEVKSEDLIGTGVDNDEVLSEQSIN